MKKKYYIILNRIKWFTPTPMNIGVSSRSERGFTLIELIVVTAIFAFVSGLILVSNKGFNDGSILRSLAYDIALTIRQAQIFGQSTREFHTDTILSTYDSQYGFYVENTVKTVNQPIRKYVLFADANDNDAYDLNEEVTIFSLQENFFIQELCVDRAGGGATDCIVGNNLDHFYVFFRRPNPDGRFLTGLPVTYEKATIYLSSPGGTRTREISVTITGQISIQ